MTVGDRIKQRRIELGWSQDELAKRAGYYAKPTISKYENAGNDISMKQVSKLAKALGVTTAYLMGWETTLDQVKASEPEHEQNTIVKPEGTYMNTADIPKAIELYTKYLNAPHEVQVSIELLLKSQQSDPLSDRLQGYNNEQTPKDS